MQLILKNKFSKEDKKDNMQTFYYFLSEQPNYPNKIMAKSKAEVKSLLMESLADESSILRILSEAEMKGKNNPKTGAIYADPDDFQNGNDFMNAVINSASNVAAAVHETEQQRMAALAQIDQMQPQQNQPKIKVDSTPIVSMAETGPKYFEEAGIQFKLENGKLYKKVWKDLSGDDAEFRIINVKTNKPADKTKFKLEQLSWSEI